MSATACGSTDTQQPQACGSRERDVPASKISSVSSSEATLVYVCAVNGDIVHEVAGRTPESRR
jgi:hypothetical protein